MGKFDGLLIGTDLDSTLLCDDKSISEENKKAIEYFMSEGGYFTITTGRSKIGITPILEQITPNAPIVLFNGAAIYDLLSDKIIHETFLDEKVTDVIKLAEDTCPFTGIEICAESGIFVSRGNRRITEQLSFEGIPEQFLHFSKVKRPWRKVLFVQEAEYQDELKQTIAGSPYFSSYNFMQSDPCYYEILPKAASKGSGILYIAELLGIPQTHTIGIGDNENDYSLVCDTGVGVAVANAIPELLKAADYISTNNNSHAISTVIHAIEDNIIKF